MYLNPGYFAGNIDIVSKFIDFYSSSGVTKEEWTQVQYTFEKISTNVIDCGELWKEEKKSLGKRRALSELLKLLDGCGLSKHRSTFVEVYNIGGSNKKRLNFERVETVSVQIQ